MFSSATNCKVMLSVLSVCKTCNVTALPAYTHSLRHVTSVASSFIQQTIAQIIRLQENYVFSDERFKVVTPKRIIVEYSSPNIAKKFHVGHFRSTVVGQTIGNILDAAGHEVTRINYLGDWGMQFAVLLMGFETDGDEKLLRDAPLKHLLEVYVNANQRLARDPAMKSEAQKLFFEMEQGSEKATSFWKFCRDISVDEYKKLYDKINVVFDVYESESMYLQKALDILVHMRKNKHLVKLSSDVEGMNIQSASWYKPNIEKTPTLVRSNGTTLYLTRDLATAVARYEKYDFDQMIYVTDRAQIEHFIQLFSILELLGYDWAKKSSGALKHVSFGRVVGMKTRDGEVVFLEDILEEAVCRTRGDRLLHSTRKLDIGDEGSLVHTLALSGLICNDLKPKLATDYRFSWTSALQSKGDTGLFLQYSHSRLQSLKRNCGVDLNVSVDCSKLVQEQAAVDLILHFAKAGDSAWLTYSELEPSHLVKFMLKLSHLVAKAHKQLSVKGQEIEIAQSRLLLFHCAQIVLSSCMKIINMEPLDKM